MPSLHKGFNLIESIDQADTFNGLNSLQILELQNNRLSLIHSQAFVPLNETLLDLNVANNQLATLPYQGLDKLTVIKAYGNIQLKEMPFFPNAHSLALSYAYHCCDYHQQHPKLLTTSPHYTSTSSSSSSSGNDNNEQAVSIPPKGTATTLHQIGHQQQLNQATVIEQHLMLTNNQTKHSHVTDNYNKLGNYNSSTSSQDAQSNHQSRLLTSSNTHQRDKHTHNDETETSHLGSRGNKIETQETDNNNNNNNDANDKDTTGTSEQASEIKHSWLPRWIHSIFSAQSDHGDKSSSPVNNSINAFSNNESDSIDYARNRSSYSPIITQDDNHLHHPSRIHHNHKHSDWNNINKARNNLSYQKDYHPLDREWSAEGNDNDMTMNQTEEEQNIADSIKENASEIIYWAPSTFTKVDLNAWHTEILNIWTNRSSTPIKLTNPSWSVSSTKETHPVSSPSSQHVEAENQTVHLILNKNGAPNKSKEEESLRLRKREIYYHDGLGGNVLLVPRQSVVEARNRLFQSHEPNLDLIDHQEDLHAIISAINGNQIMYSNNTYSSSLSSSLVRRITRDADLKLRLKRPVHCLPEPSPFMPCQDLFGWWTLRFGIWFVFLMAFIGNGLVIVVLTSIRSSSSSLAGLMMMSSSKRSVDVPRFLVTNLAVADFLMAIYLGILALVDASTLGYFKVYAIKWQYSFGCKLAGFLGVFSSELSVFILAIITLERNYAITNAVHLNRRLSLRKASIIMACGYLFAIVMAVLPLVGISDYRKFAICLPLEIDSSIYSFIYVSSLIGVNLFSFLLLLACYVRMYCAIRGSQAWNSNDTRIAKRMAILVFTDFLCWAPISFIGLFALFGRQLVTMDGVKIFTIFVLPLNSIANPFLYAITTKKFKRDLELLMKRVRTSNIITKCRKSLRATFSPEEQTNFDPTDSIQAEQNQQNLCDVCGTNAADLNIKNRLDELKQLPLLVEEYEEKRMYLRNSLGVARCSRCKLLKLLKSQPTDNSSNQTSRRCQLSPIFSDGQRPNSPSPFGCDCIDCRARYEQGNQLSPSMSSMMANVVCHSHSQRVKSPSQIIHNNRKVASQRRCPSPRLHERVMGNNFNNQAVGFCVHCGGAGGGRRRTRNRNRKSANVEICQFHEPLLPKRQVYSDEKKLTKSGTKSKDEPDPPDMRPLQSTFASPILSTSISKSFQSLGKQSFIYQYDDNMTLMVKPVSQNGRNREDIAEESMFKSSPKLIINDLSFRDPNRRLKTAKSNQSLCEKENLQSPVLSKQQSEECLSDLVKPNEDSDMRSKSVISNQCLDRQGSLISINSDNRPKSCLAITYLHANNSLRTCRDDYRPHSWSQPDYYTNPIKKLGHDITDEKMQLLDAIGPTIHIMNGAHNLDDDLHESMKPSNMSRNNKLDLNELLKSKESNNLKGRMLKPLAQAWSNIQTISKSSLASSKISSSKSQSISTNNQHLSQKQKGEAFSQLGKEKYKQKNSKTKGNQDQDEVFVSTSTEEDVFDSEDNHKHVNEIDVARQDAIKEKLTVDQYNPLATCHRCNSWSVATKLEQSYVCEENRGLSQPLTITILSDAAGKSQLQSVVGLKDGNKISRDNHVLIKRNTNTDDHNRIKSKNDFYRQQRLKNQQSFNSESSSTRRTAMTTISSSMDSETQIDLCNVTSTSQPIIHDVINPASDSDINSGPSSSSKNSSVQSLQQISKKKNTSTEHHSSCPIIVIEPMSELIVMTEPLEVSNHHEELTPRTHLALHVLLNKSSTSKSKNKLIDEKEIDDVMSSCPSILRRPQNQESSRRNSKSLTNGISLLENCAEINEERKSNSWQLHLPFESDTLETTPIVEIDMQTISQSEFDKRVMQTMSNNGKRTTETLDHLRGCSRLSSAYYDTQVKVDSDNETFSQPRPKSAFDDSDKCNIVDYQSTKKYNSLLSVQTRMPFLAEKPNKGFSTTLIEDILLINDQRNELNDENFTGHDNIGRKRDLLIVQNLSSSPIGLIRSVSLSNFGVNKEIDSDSLVAVSGDPIKNKKLCNSAVCCSHIEQKEAKLSCDLKTKVYNLGKEFDRNVQRPQRCLTITAEDASSSNQSSSGLLATATRALLKKLFETSSWV